MAHIKKEFIESLIASVDIVNVISSHVQLKRSGTSFMACCPFHSEKSPSFSVNQRGQYFNCFGCHKAGNVITFLMEFEHISFVEAVEELAQFAGVQVEYDEGYTNNTPRVNVTPSLVELMDQCVRYYQLALQQSPEAQAYLAQRGLNEETIQKYQIGFAPASMDYILNNVGKNDSKTIADLQSLGMIAASNYSGGRGYDKFHNRIMIPIRNKKGQTVAFGGRVLNNDKPKYINSAENPIFKKGHELFNLDFVRKLPRQEDDFIMVTEGYMDVISLDQYGVHNAVASLGTSTTEDQLKALFLLTSHIIFCYDGDQAGQDAAWRIFKMILPLMTDDKIFTFCFLPVEHDPDTFVRAEGKEAFQRYLKQGISPVEFLNKYLMQHFALATQQGIQLALSFATELIAKVTNAPIVRSTFIRQTAILLGWPEDEIAQLCLKAIKGSVRAQVTSPQAIPAPTPAIEMTNLRTLVAMLLQNPYLFPQIPMPQEFLSLLKNYSDQKITILEELFAKIGVNPSISTGVLLGSYQMQPKLESFMNYLITAQKNDPDRSIELKVADLLTVLKSLLVETLQARELYLRTKSRQQELTNEELSESSFLCKTLQSLDTQRNGNS